MPTAYDDVATKTTANVAEVNAAISTIENSSEYKAYSELADAQAEADELDAALDTPAEIEAALKGALANVNAKSYANDADYIALADYAEANVPNYDKWAALVKAEADIDNGAAQASYEALSGAMKALRSGYNTVVAGVENPTYTQLLNQAKTDLTTFATLDTTTNASSTVYTYAHMKAVVTDVNAANDLEDAIDDLKEALAKVGAKASEIKTASEDDDPIDKLTDLVAGDIATKAGKYNTLIARVAAVKNELKTPENLSATALYGLIDNATNGLYQLTKTATGNDELTVADLLAGTVITPENPDNSGSNDNQGAGDADNNTDDKKDDTTVGNTGAIASANGTASSTVAVVAGIATALTAAGAGVVAYRNARREA